MLKRLAAEWFGYFEKGELAKYLLLGVIFFLIIGTYWLLSITRDDVFNTFVGWGYQPRVKILSSFFAFPLVMVYSKLADRFQRHRLFYALSTVYLVVMAIFYGVLYSMYAGHVVRDPYTVTAWIYFVIVESFGSIMVALFWAFAADISTPSSAKRGYFLVAIFGQLGAILFTSGVSRYVKQIGIAHVLGFSLFAIGLIPLFVYIFRNSVSKSLFTGYAGEQKQSTSKRPGLLESIKVVFQKPYLLGIFAIIAMFEMIVTVFEFRFKMLIPSEDFPIYLASYSMYVNIVALVCLLGGIGNIGRKLGLKRSLMLLPALVAICAVALWYYPVLHVAFWIMVSTKALNFALNQPSKEQLYIPTTYDAKYKSKAFIDMFGSRASKGVGSLINEYQGVIGEGMFAIVSTWAALGLCAAWVMVAAYLGTRYKKAIENQEYVC